MCVWEREHSLERGGMVGVNIGKCAAYTCICVAHICTCGYIERGFSAHPTAASTHPTADSTHRAAYSNHPVADSTHQTAYSTQPTAYSHYKSTSATREHTILSLQSTPHASCTLLPTPLILLPPLLHDAYAHTFSLIPTHLLSRILILTLTVSPHSL